MFMLVSAALIYDKEKGATERQKTSTTGVLISWFIICCLLSVLNTVHSILMQNQGNQVTAGHTRQTSVVDGIKMTQVDDFLLSENPIRKPNAEMSTQVIVLN
jgi:hypothetical protein